MITLLVVLAVIIIWFTVMNIVNISIDIQYNDLIVKKVLKSFPFFVWRRILGDGYVTLWMVLAIPFIFGIEILTALCLIIGYYPVKAIGWFFTLKVW